MKLGETYDDKLVLMLDIQYWICYMYVNTNLKLWSVIMKNRCDNNDEIIEMIESYFFSSFR